MDKLKLEKFKKIALFNIPKNTIKIKIFDNKITKDTDLVIAYFDNWQNAYQFLSKTLLQINEKTMVYIMYPKKSSKSYSADFNRDDFIKMDLPYKANGLIAFNEDFSVITLKNQELFQKQQSGKKSQCVDDYIDYIAEIKKRLKNDALNEYNFFNSLTEGYQKGWAKFVYSPIKKETQDKKYEEMIQLLKSKKKFK